MFVNNNELNELLKCFGLSLKIENGNAIFTDIDTNQPMQSSIATISTEVITSDASELLSGIPCYLHNDSKHYKLKIRINSLFDETDQDIIVSTISRIEMKEPNVYESCNFTGFDNGTRYAVKETKYIQHDGKDERRYDEVLSDILFNAGELDYRGGIIVMKDHNTRSDVCFKENAVTGEITPDFKDEYFSEISLQETMELIDQSIVFKDTVGILCPKLSEAYTNAKSNSFGPTK